MLGKTLGGRYYIIRYLGGGGFGQAYLAEDRQLPGAPRCVLKQLKPQSTNPSVLQIARRLFKTEAETLQELGKYPQIPQLFAYFEENKQFYLVQELIEGHPLSNELKAGQKWSEDRVVTLLQDILKTLEFVHQHKVIHRDIKPANLIRRVSDGKIVLIDFGAVKQISAQTFNSQGKTNMTVAIGSPGYVASEQLAGKPRFSSDIYAVGMIGIQALTGVYPQQLPQDSRTSEIIWRNQAQVSPELAKVLDKMVRYDFRDRYLSATEALQELTSKITTTIFPSSKSPNSGSTWPTSVKPIQPLKSILKKGLIRLSTTAVAAIVIIQSLSLISLISHKSSKQPNQTPASQVRPIMPSPVASWNFDLCNKSGKPMLANELSNEPQGTMVRGATCADGRLGYAGFFDGVDDIIEIADKPNFHFTTQMTVTAWVKPLRLEGRIYGLQTIVNKWYAMDSYMLVIENGNFVFTVAFPGGKWGNPVKVSAPATLDVWTHITGVYNGQMLLLYINGELAASTAISGTIQDSDRPISIGNHPSWNAFRGIIDEIRLYNVALDAAQISQLLSETKK